MSVNTFSHGPVAAAAVFLAMLAWIGCTPALAETIKIEMKSTPEGNVFEPTSREVKVGDDVVWENKSGTHTATPDDGQPEPFPDTETVDSEKSSAPWKVTGAARTIKYHCDFHASMKGELVIKP